MFSSEIPWTATYQAPLSFTISQSFLRLTSIELMMLSNHLILCCPSLLPSAFISIRVFSNESASATVLPMNTQGWFPLGFIGLICFQSKALKNKNLHSITIAPSSSMNLSLLATSLLLATKRNTDGQNNKSLRLPMVATTMLTSPLRRAWQGTRQEKYTIRLGTQIHHSLQGIGPISLFQSFFWVF